MSIRFPGTRALTTHAVRATLALLLCAAAPVSAATFCIGNGDELSDILEGSGTNAANNNEDDVIRLRSGRYLSDANALGDNTFDFDPAQGDSLSISGGWNGNCTAQTLDPAATILDGNGRRMLLSINQRTGFTSLTGQISISNLTLFNGVATFPANFVRASQAALRIDIVGAAGSTVTVENVVMTGNRALPAATGGEIALVRLASGGVLRFRNNVIYDNDMRQAPLTSSVRLLADQAVGFVSNNSVFGNQVSGAGVGFLGFGTLTLSNNVLAENTSSSAAAYQLRYTTPGGQSSALTLTNNHITSRDPAMLVFSEINTTTGPAMWSGTGYVRVPNAGSQLRDSGTNSPLGGLSAADIRGLTRVVNSVVDRGAVEAQPPANTGPIISALQPLVNSTTTLQATDAPFQTTRVFFFTQNGNGTGQSTMNCDVTAGNGAVVVRPVQTVSNGGIALPVDLALDNPVAGSGNIQATLSCEVFRENANVYTLTYFFVVRDPLLFRSGFE